VEVEEEEEEVVEEEVDLEGRTGPFRPPTLSLRIDLARVRKRVLATPAPGPGIGRAVVEVGRGGERRGAVVDWP